MIGVLLFFTGIVLSNFFLPPSPSWSMEQVAAHYQQDGLSGLNGRQASEDDLAFIEDLAVRCGGGAALVHGERELARIGVVGENWDAAFDKTRGERATHRSDANEAYSVFHVFAPLSLASSGEQVIHSKASSKGVL